MFFLCFFYVVRKIRPYFVHFAQNKALFCALRKQLRKQNANDTQAMRKQCAYATQNHTYVCLRGTCAEAIFFVFFLRGVCDTVYVRPKIRPYFGKIRPYGLAYINCAHV